MGGFGSILDQPTRGQTQADVDAALAARGPGPTIGPATPQPTTPDALAAARAALFLQGLTQSGARSNDPNSIFNGPNRYNPNPPLTLPGAQPADVSSSRGVLRPSRPMGYDDYMKLADMAAGTIGLTPPHPNMSPSERLQNLVAVGSLGLGPLMEEFQLSKLAETASKAMETGGTFDVSTGKALTGSGYLVADPEFTRTILPHENQRAVIKSFLKDPAVRARLQQGAAHLGVYKNPDGLPEVNITDRLPLEQGESTARDLARARNQNSFGHLVNGEYQGDLPTKRDFTGRRVTGTALRDLRGNIYQRPLPSNHAQVLDDVPPGTGLESRGFVLDNGTYVSPEEAMDVAEQQSQVVQGRFERNRTNPRDLHAFDLKENQPKPPAPSYKVEDEGPAEHLANAQSILNMHADMHGAHTSLDAGDLGAVADRVRKAGHSLTLTPQTTVGDLQAQLRGMMGPGKGEAQPLEDVASGIRTKAGLTHEPLPPVGKVDPEAGQHMARAYSRLESAPNDPEVQSAYRQFVSETAAQAQALRKAGYSWEFTDKDPYGSSAEMLQDLHDNHHIKVLRTQPGQGHPLLSNDENNEFRAVHDILGHGSTGASFGPRGEEQAYRNHSALYSPAARRVLATETRGQNSWFNYGPSSHLPVKERPFAQQKAALFPANLTGDYPDVRKAALLDLPEGAPSVLGASDYSFGARPAGEPGLAYHGTYKPDFSVPTASRDLGPHIGTPAQASTITDTMSPQGHRIMPLRDFTKNPARVPEDLATWDDPEDAADALARSGHIDQPLADEIHTARRQQYQKVQQHMAAAENEFKERNGRGMTLGEYSNVSNQFNEDYKNGLHDKLRKALIDQGYDSVLYPNAYEGRGLTIKHVEGRRPTFEDPETESKIVLNPKRDLQNALEPRALGGSPTTPAGRQGTVLPEQDVTPLAQAVAHHTVGTSDYEGFLKNLRENEPGLAGLEKSAPGVMDRLYEAAKVHQKFAESLTPFEDVNKLAQSTEGQGIAKWYGGLRRTLIDAGVPPDDADMLDRFGSILSAQRSPQDEMKVALRAWDAWAHGEPLQANTLNINKEQAAALHSQAKGGPFSLAEKPGGALKTANYYLQRRGLTESDAPAIDRHIIRAYTGSERMPTPAQRNVIQGRLQADARKAGMSSGEFQARVWGGHTKYEAGFGKPGATPEDWLKYHLAHGAGERLLDRYPGLQALAEEGARKLEDQ